MSALRLLRTRRQRQFLVAYVAWVLTLFVLYWWEPYAVPERWTGFRWLVGSPLVIFALFYAPDLLGSVLDLYRVVSRWVKRGA